MSKTSNPTDSDHSSHSSRSSTPAAPSTAASSYLPSTISAFLRRLSSDPSPHKPSHTKTFPLSSSATNSFSSWDDDAMKSDGPIYTPRRTASPFQPPPLYPLSLKGYKENTGESGRLLTKAIAEEIRLLVPPRLQLCEDWNLVYSLEQDGSSLGTLYAKGEELRGVRNGFVLVVRDGDGGLFGTYLSEAPHPSPHYFGTGECFLWRASILDTNSLPPLPLPPSADTASMQRSTTIAHTSNTKLSLLSPSSDFTNPSSRASTPERIRFKAFPYSGINDYLMYCEAGYLSIGGGDGHYGLWLDAGLEKGISSTCLTFGNEPLSEEGEKFEILGVEMWSIGNNWRGKE